MIGQRLECMSTWFEDVRKREDRPAPRVIMYITLDLFEFDLYALENSL